MLGQAGKNPLVGIAAAALVLVVGYFALCRSSQRPLAAGDSQTVRACLKEGHKFLADAPAPAEAAPKCPTCGGESALGLVFECQRGHLFVGFLEKPPSATEPTAAKAKKATDEYARNLPLLLRPGLDKTWAPGGAGKSPVCPVCGLGIRRPVTNFKGVSLDDIHMGSLPASGEGK